MKNENILNKPVVIMLLATFTCFLWGSAFPSIKISYSMLGIADSPFYIKLQFAGYRFLLASLMIFAFMLIMRMNLRITKKDIKYLLALGLFQTGIQYLFFYVGLSNTPGVKASIINSTGTFFSIIIPHFYYNDDKMSTKKWIGLLIGFAGVVFVNVNKGSLDASFRLIGEGFLILASIMGAISSIMAKEITRRLNPILVSCYQMFLGSIVMILLSMTFTKGHMLSLTAEFIPLFIYLAFISSASFCMWYMLLKYNKVSTVSIYKFQIPIWGSILSTIVIPGESFTAVTAGALVLVCIGIIIVNSNGIFEKKSSLHN